MPRKSEEVAERAAVSEAAGVQAASSRKTKDSEGVQQWTQIATLRDAGAAAVVLPLRGCW